MLLTDVVMPRMSGRELADGCRPCSAHIRVLYMSGYERESLPAESAPPAEAFLPKPFTPEALLQKVRAALDTNEGAPSQ